MKHKTSNTNYYNKNNGLTLLELVIIVSILLLLIFVITGAFLGFRDTQALNSNVEQVVSILDEARFNTLSSQKSLQYGVRFEINKIVLFEGDTYSASDPNNKEFLLSSAIEISNIFLAGGVSDVVFQKLTGETNQYGTIIMRSKKNNSNSKIINLF